jgi:hypothetical protein
VPISGARQEHFQIHFRDVLEQLQENVRGIDIGTQALVRPQFQDQDQPLVDRDF